MRKLFAVELLCVGLLSSASAAQGLQLSGGIDARYTRSSVADADGFELRGLFLNLRKVWADEAGDRWIAVAQADAEHDLEEVRPYQLYLQYKGPLGKWNLRAGHFLLPFGLLATHDTERLIVQGLEETSLGIRKDTGGELLGQIGDWSYAFYLTEGVADRRLGDVDGSPLLGGRVAYTTDAVQAGLSVLSGRVLRGSDAVSPTIYERRIALDATVMLGPLTLRGEGIAGSDDGRTVGGGVALADYAVTPALEANARLGVWWAAGRRAYADLGASYKIWRGLWTRVAYRYESGERRRNEAVVQLYFDISHQL